MNGNKALKIGAWALAGAVLCGALVYYNFIDKDETESRKATVADECPDFTVGKYAVENGDFVYTDETFTLSDCRGKVVVLNFWATWCQPCKEEIPHFNEFYEKYDGEVEVVVINGETSWTAQEFAQNILNNEATKDYTQYYAAWTEYACTFARYEADNNVYELFAVAGSLPVTVVVDKAGVIQFIAESGMSLQDLETVVLPLL